LVSPFTRRPSHCRCVQAAEKLGAADGEHKVRLGGAIGLLVWREAMFLWIGITAWVWDVNL
jgi:hypothetical protein